MRLRQNIEYLRYIALHKWHVGVACIREGIPLRALTHDLSKFRPRSEWRPYREYFYGTHGADNQAANKGGKPTETSDRSFDLAWLKHIHRNRHHWQWYLLRKDDGTTTPLPMQQKDMIEMLCDWYGAGAAIHGEASWTRTLLWYQENASKIKLHPSTQARVERFLSNRAVEESRRA